MPVQAVPVQPEFDDAVTEADLLAAQGVPINRAQVLQQAMTSRFTPTAEDLQGAGLQEQYAQAQQQALLAEEMAQRQYEQDLNQMKGQELQMDWTPLMALADAWGVDKSNLAQSYKRPMSAQEKNAQIMSLQEKLLSHKQAAAKGRTEALSSAIAAFKAAKENPLKQELMRSQIAANMAAAGQKQLGKPVPEAAIQKLSDFEAGLNQLGIVEQNLKQNADVFGPVQGRVGGINPLDERAQSVQSDINAARQIIGKAVEGGVLRKEDEVKYQKILPNISDTPAVAMHKMKQFRQNLSKDYTRYKNKLGEAGYNVKNISEVNAPGAQGAPSGPEIREYNGKIYELQGDHWVEVK